MSEPPIIRIPFNSEPWSPSPESFRAIDQAIQIARLMPVGEDRNGLLSAAARIWIINNSIIYTVTSEATKGVSTQSVSEFARMEEEETI